MSLRVEEDELAELFFLVFADICPPTPLWVWEWKTTTTSEPYDVARSYLANNSGEFRPMSIQR